MRLLFAIVGVFALAFFLIGSRIEGRMNRVEPVALAVVSQAAKDLHRSAVVVDLHADPLVWDRDLLARSTIGQVDLPRLRDGGVALQDLTGPFTPYANGQGTGTLVAAGMTDTPAGDTFSPTLATAYCSGVTSSNSANFAYGLPGPVREVVRGAAVFGP